MAIDCLPKRDISEVIIPPGAVSIGQNPGVSGAWSAYSQIIAAASLTYPFVLCGAYVILAFVLTNQGTLAGQLNLQIATGAASSEVPIAEGHGGLLLAPGGTGQTVSAMTGFTVFFQPQLIPASTRIAMRSSTTSSVTTPISVYLFGYDARSFAPALNHREALRYIQGLKPQTQGSYTWPSPGATAVTGGNPAWAYGAAVQYIASAASPLFITGLFGSALLAAIRAQVKIGIGAAGSEQWMSMVGLPNTASTAGPFCDCWLPRPLLVKAGEAVSIAAATSTASQAINIALKGFALK